VVKKVLMGSGGSGGGDNSGGSGKNGHQEGHADGQSECLDEHDWDGAIDMTSEEVEELNEEIDHALREGAILAGKMKGNLSERSTRYCTPKLIGKKHCVILLRVMPKATTNQHGADLTADTLRATLSCQAQSGSKPSVLLLA
jgi:hypothetical protein